MIRMSCFLDIFVKKRIKREIPDQFSGKSPCNKTTILAKRNGFLCEIQRVFLTGFWTKKEQNVRFQAGFQEKTLIIERQFFQNVTVFYDRNILFFGCFCQKKEQNVIFQTNFQGKANIIERPF